jgi:hypothetical protein
MSELPTSALPHCKVCGKPVATFSQALHEVVGYERDRAQGGTNHIIARHRTGRIVGSCCAGRVQRGVVEQETLL